MSEEGQRLDYKSLRAVQGKKQDWAELAKDCVAFANAEGGQLLIGIEDGDKGYPPPGQRISDQLVADVRRRFSENTINVTLAVMRCRNEENDGEYLRVDISRSNAIASTTDGRYFIRIGDATRPVVGEEIQRLLNERSGQPWETQQTDIPSTTVDARHVSTLLQRLRNSDRVKAAVKEKSDAELLEHYSLTKGSRLTHLGVLCIGHRSERAALGTAPVIQYIKRDDNDNKINKICWDDHELTPFQLLEAVWDEVPDFQESYELPEGLIRRNIPAFDSRIIRELLVNALVHRPYTQRGDIYLNMYPDRLELVNPGLLPLGVTPQNILHKSVRRNSELARLFHDVHLMEREGTGLDLVYEVLTSQGRALPTVTEGEDSVTVTIPRRIIKPEVIDFLAKADLQFHPNQRERIMLGILAQSSDGATARDLCEILELPDSTALSTWLGNLLKWKIVGQSGRTRGTRYFIKPHVMQNLGFPSQTTLTRIEPHRLRELLREDLQRHPTTA